MWGNAEIEIRQPDEKRSKGTKNRRRTVRNVRLDPYSSLLAAEREVHKALLEREPALSGTERRIVQFTFRR
jgi:hypothetical protein